MHLHGMVYYRSNSDGWTEEWSQKDWKARNLVAAVKQRPFKGYSIFQLKSGTYRVEDTPAGKLAALKIVGQVLALKIKAAGYDSASLVPVPSSDHVDPTCEFTGSRIAMAVQMYAPTLVPNPVLYFDQIQDKSAEGGTRDPHVIKHQMRLSEVPHGPTVLLDDVCTTGGHLIASARLLASQGVRIDDAFVVGRTAWEKPDDMFKVEQETIG